MAKLTDYAEITRFDSNGILIADGSSGTKKISVQNAARDLAGMVSAVQHRNVYGGRNLGSTVTAAQWAAIGDGSFDGLFVGDFWKKNNIEFAIADPNYFLNCGDTNFNKNHLVIVPSANLYNHVMNDTNTTEGGYVGSKMYTEGLAQALAIFEDMFGAEHILSHRDYLVNAVTDGYPSAGAWYDSKVELMNEVMVYGCYHYASMNKGSTAVNKYTTGKQQLALFRLNPRMANIRANYWLRDVVSSASFARVHDGGVAYYAGASLSIGVRPYCVIGV